MSKISTTDKKTNFGFGKLTKNEKITINLLRQEICLQMAQYKTLIGFKDFNDVVKVLSLTAINVCRSYAGADEKIKARPDIFENFVKLVLSDILEKMSDPKYLV